MVSQVYTQPVFSLVEAPVKARRGTDDLPVWLQFGMRIVYVVLVTIVGLLVSVLTAQESCVRQRTAGKGCTGFCCLVLDAIWRRYTTVPCDGAE